MALVTINGLAREFVISRETVYNLINRHKIQTYRKVGDRKTYLNRNEILPFLKLRPKHSSRIGLTPTKGNPDLDVERLQAALNGGPVDEQTLDQLKTVTDVLMQKSWNTEPQSLLPVLTSHFRSFGNILLQVPSKLSSRALSMAGEAAFVAGYLALKAGLTSEFNSYWQTSEWMAKLAGDTSLQAILTTSQGWRAYDYGKSEQALKIFDKAQSVFEKNPNPALGAFVYSSRSYVLNAGGQEQAAARELDNSDRYLQQLPGDDAPIYTLETVREEVEEARGWHLFHVGKYSEAASTFEQMLSRINPTWKSWQAISKADLASVYAQRGNIEQAVHTFSSALRTAREAGAIRYEQRVFRRRQQWLGNNDSPPVRRLDEEFTITSTRSLT